MKYNEPYIPNRTRRKPGDITVGVALFLIVFGVIVGSIGTALICYLKWAI